MSDGPGGASHRQVQRWTGSLQAWLGVQPQTGMGREVGGPGAARQVLSFNKNDGQPRQGSLLSPGSRDSFWLVSECRLGQSLAPGQSGSRRPDARLPQELGRGPLAVRHELLAALRRHRAGDPGAVGRAECRGLRAESQPPPHQGRAAAGAPGRLVPPAGHHEGRGPQRVREAAQAPSCRCQRPWASGCEPGADMCPLRGGACGATGTRQGWGFCLTGRVPQTRHAPPLSHRAAWGDRSGALMPTRRFQACPNLFQAEGFWERLAEARVSQRQGWKLTWVPVFLYPGEKSQSIKSGQRSRLSLTMSF